MDELQVRRLFHIVISFQNGKAIAVGQCVDFLSGSAQRAIRHKACHIAGDVLGGEDAHHRHLVHLCNRAEYRGDPLQAPAVILDALHRSARRFTGVYGGDQKQHVFTGNHARQIVAEDELAVGVIFGCDDADVPAGVHGKAVVFGEPPCEERADDLAAVHTDDRVDLLLIDVVLHKDTGRISRHAVLMLHAGYVKVVAVVGVAGRKMSAKRRDLQIWIFSGFDTHGTHHHSSSLNIHSACRDDLDVRVGMFSCYLCLMSLRCGQPFFYPHYSYIQ